MIALCSVVPATKMRPMQEQRANLGEPYVKPYLKGLYEFWMTAKNGHIAEAQARAISVDI